MQWIHNYQLFLLDFDGLLVNTEELHYRAYQQMCLERGFELRWDWPTYCKAAMYSSTGIREAIYREFPDLHRFEPCWDILYREKKRAYYELLLEGAVELMPGAERLLHALEEANVLRCVVTHAPIEQVKLLRKQFPILDTIPHWLTREDYVHPKPHPECYEKAIEKFGVDKERVIGFEDTPRGLQALLGAEAQGIFISWIFKKEDLKKLIDKTFAHYRSLEELCEKMAG